MNEPASDMDPDWDTPLALALTPETIMHTLFASADNVHTGWDTCIDHSLVVVETTAVEDDSGNHCRLVEQEYVEGEAQEVTWHDWSVELKIGDVYVSAHWRAPDNASPAEWEWCASEAESSFSTACVLVGQRVRRGLIIEEPARRSRTPRTHH